MKPVSERANGKVTLILPRPQALLFEEVKRMMEKEFGCALLQHQIIEVMANKYLEGKTGK